MSEEGKVLIILITSFMVFAVLSIAALGFYSQPHYSCQEDAVLVGVGEFEDGQWTKYVCGPSVDDYSKGN